MIDLVGVLVGDYFLLERLASEGHVETYHARPTLKAGYDVLLRLFRAPFPDPTNFQVHFATEVEKVWRCQHKGLLPLYEFGAGDDLLFCVTILPEADTLAHMLASRKVFPLEYAICLIIQLCDAVDYLHSRDIVHGNIQPSSVYISNDQTMLTNYAMRHAYQDGDSLTSLHDEGNIAYIAPEQFLGMGCPSSDVYGLGTLLYHLLSGSPPYAGRTFEEITWQRAHDSVPSLRAQCPHVPEVLEHIVHKALASKAEQRFIHAQALAEALLVVVPQNSERDGADQRTVPLQLEQHTHRPRLGPVRKIRKF